MKSPKHTWIVFLVIGLLCVAYVWFFGVATVFALEARYIGWKMPAVKSAPLPVFDSSISQSNGLKLSYFGYDLEVPWSDLDEGKTKQIGQMQLIAFHSGRSILFSVGKPKEFIKTFLSSSGGQSENLAHLYGPDALRSDYALHRLILEATPQRVGLFSARREAVGNTMLLVFKGIMMPRGGESGVFNVRTSGFAGFQFGDPRSYPKSLSVEMFADDGGFALTFARGPSTAAITQPEINRTIQSVRRIGVQARAAEADSRTR